MIEWYWLWKAVVWSLSYPIKKEIIVQTFLTSSAVHKALELMVWSLVMKLCRLLWMADESRNHIKRDWKVDSGATNGPTFHSPTPAELSNSPLGTSIIFNVVGRRMYRSTLRGVHYVYVTHTQIGDRVTLSLAYIILAPKISNAVLPAISATAGFLVMLQWGSGQNDAGQNEVNKKCDNIMVTWAWAIAGTVVRWYNIQQPTRQLSLTL